MLNSEDILAHFRTTAAYHLFFFFLLLPCGTVKTPEMVVQENPCRPAVSEKAGRSSSDTGNHPTFRVTCSKSAFSSPFWTRASGLHLVELLLPDWLMSRLCYQAIAASEWSCSSHFSLKAARRWDGRGLQTEQKDDWFWVELPLLCQKDWQCSVRGCSGSFSTIKWISMEGGAFLWDAHSRDPKWRIHLG